MTVDVILYFGSRSDVALRCRARAGFSRRSRENPDVWFRPCIAGQDQTVRAGCRLQTADNDIAGGA